MRAFVHRQPRILLSRFATKLSKVLCPALVLVSLACVGGWWQTAQASGQGTSRSALLTDQGAGGIQGYVAGNGPVAAYTCPDTAKCPIKLTLTPGTVVLIVDNVVGGHVPGLNSNAWRKIVYQGLTLYVPLAYIKVGRPSNGPDISLVQTSFEDDSTAAPTFPSGTGFTTAPGARGTPVILRGVVLICLHNLVPSNGYCCPQGYTFNGSACMAPTIGQVTWYAPTDGRIDGNAGDRIAIYCRKTGRIEVWSIHDSQGHFLVEFNHLAVDAAGKSGFSLSVGAQLIVTIGGDGHGTYWAALHGGPFQATGTGDFAKTFQCYVAP